MNTTLKYALLLLCVIVKHSDCFQNKALFWKNDNALGYSTTSGRTRAKGYVWMVPRNQDNLEQDNDTNNNNNKRSKNNNSNNNNPNFLTTRRNVLHMATAITSGMVVWAVQPSPSDAGEVGARITKAVTTSDLGISVRTSVVRGAQIMDQLDGQWEKFSDKFGLGSERSKQGSRPKPKKIPDPLPLNVRTAQTILDISDQAFCAQTGISRNALQEQITKVANLVKISFERSGLQFLKNDDNNPLLFENGPQFNFVAYAHFKAYSDLILEQKIPFGPFRSKFESQVGEQLISLLLPSYSKPQQRGGPETIGPSEEFKKDSINIALQAIDELGKVLVKDGLVALVDRSSVNDDQIYDWIDDTADLEFTVAADLDTTLNAQILLQEQGFRLYPNFARYAVNYLMGRVAPGQKVSVMDYYFDTDYNSDPDKFEVKEILLSVILENP